MRRAVGAVLALAVGAAHAQTTEHSMFGASNRTQTNNQQSDNGNGGLKP